MDTQHVLGHAAWARTCSIDMDMQHVPVHPRVHVHAACLYPCYLSMSMLHVHVHSAYRWPCYISMSMLHVLVHAACLCPCCMFTSMWHRHRDAAGTWNAKSSRTSFMSMLHIQVHAECLSPCCVSMSILRVHIHGTCPCPNCKTMSLLHRLEDTPTASMSMSILHA